MNLHYVQQATTEFTGWVDTNTSALDQLPTSGHSSSADPRKASLFQRILVRMHFKDSWKLLYRKLCQPSFPSHSSHQTGPKVGMSLKISFFCVAHKNSWLYAGVDLPRKKPHHTSRKEHPSKSFFLTNFQLPISVDLVFSAILPKAV